MDLLDSFDNTEFKTKLTSLLSSTVPKLVIGKLFESIITRGPDQDFNSALKSTISEVDRHYEFKLFGGSISKFFEDPEIKNSLKESLLKYGEFDLQCFDHIIDIETLPKDFLSTFYVFFIDETTKFPSLRKEVAEWLDSYNISVLTKDSNEIKELLHEIGSKLSDLEIKKQKVKQPKKIEYEPAENYIPRSLALSSESEFNKLYFKRNLFEEGSDEESCLTDLITQKNRILILGIAGFGKSYELKNLAHHFSADERSIFPVLIRLNQIIKPEIENILETVCEDWESVVHNNLLLIFDAMDEVHHVQFDLFVRDMNRFSLKYPNVKIVISCRNNLYSLKNPNGHGGTLQDFSEYVIKPLSHEEIAIYLEKHLNSDRENFMNQMWKVGSYELIHSPFYLIQICELHNSKGFIPNRKSDLFEYLIDLRIEKDLNKFRSVGLDLDEYRYKIKEALSKVAFAAECLGKNHLDESSELQRFISNPELLKRIKRTFLFNRGVGKKWEFEHNNFQEYLAAVFLSQKEFGTIQSVLSFGGDHSKIKPTWVNTLSLLISIMEHGSAITQQLIAWITAIEPDILFRMEKDKVELNQREIIVKDIVHHYESRKLWLRSEKFDTHDIANFISESQDILNWLIDRLDICKDNISLFHSIELLRGLDALENETDRIGSILIQKLKMSEFSDTGHYEVTKLLVQLNYLDKNIPDILASNLRYKSSQNIRAAIYLYISHFKLSDSRIDLLITGISIARERNVYRNASRHTKREVFIDAEARFLIEAFKELKVAGSFKKMLLWAIDSTSDPIKDHESEILEIVLNSDMLFTFLDDEMLKLVIELYMKLSRRYLDELLEKFLSLFDKTNSRLKVFRFIYDECDNGRNENFYLLPKVANKQALEFIVQRYKEGVLEDDFILGFRNMLSHQKDKDLHDWFYDAINKCSTDSFLYEEKVIPNWDKLQLSKRKMDIKLLFNRKEFLRRAIDIFAETKKGVLSSKDLNKYFLERDYDLIFDNDIVVDIVKDIAKDNGSVTINEIKLFLDNKTSWTWLKISTLIREDKKGGIKFGKREHNYLERWFESNKGELNFKTALTQSGTRGLNYRRAEMYSIYLHREYDFPLEEEKVLEFVYMDYPHILIERQEKNDEEVHQRKSLTEWVASRVGKDKTKKMVMSCLNSEYGIEQVKFNLFSYCVKEGIVECTPLILSGIQSLPSYGLWGLIDNYFELKGDATPIIKLLAEFSEEHRLHVLNLLGECNDSRFESECLKYLGIESDQGSKLKFISLLIDHPHLSGFQKLAVWIIKYQTFPESLRKINPPKEMINEVLQLYLNIYELGIKHDFRDKSVYQADRPYLDVIIKSGAISDSNYILIKNKLNEWIESYEEQQYLFWRLEELDRMYFTNKSPNLSLVEINKLLE